VRAYALRQARIQQRWNNRKRGSLAQQPDRGDSALGAASPDHLASNLAPRTNRVKFDRLPRKRRG